jgi:hypothetical protein
MVKKTIKMRTPHNLKGISFIYEGKRHFVTLYLSDWKQCVTNTRTSYTTIWDSRELRKLLKITGFRKDLKFISAI